MLFVSSNVNGKKWISFRSRVQLLHKVSLTQVLLMAVWALGCTSYQKAVHLKLQSIGTGSIRFPNTHWSLEVKNLYLLDSLATVLKKKMIITLIMPIIQSVRTKHPGLCFWLDNDDINNLMHNRALKHTASGLIWSNHYT